MSSDPDSFRKNPNQAAAHHCVRDPLYVFVAINRLTARMTDEANQFQPEISVETIVSRGGLWLLTQRGLICVTCRTSPGNSSLVPSHHSFQFSYNIF